MADVRAVIRAHTIVTTVCLVLGAASGCTDEGSTPGGDSADAGRRIIDAAPVPRMDAEPPALRFDATFQAPPPDAAIDAAVDAAIDAQLPDAAPPPVCESLAPCGGDPTGSWTMQTTCGGAHAPPWADGFPCGQPRQLSVRHYEEEALDLVADGTFARTRTDTLGVEGVFEVRCVLRGDCEGLQQDIAGFPAPLSCGDINLGACSCEAAANERVRDRGTWQVDADTLTLTTDDGVSESWRFCVDDGGLTLAASDFETGRTFSPYCQERFARAPTQIAVQLGSLGNSDAGDLASLAVNPEDGSLGVVWVEDPPRVFPRVMFRRFQPGLPIGEAVQVSPPGQTAGSPAIAFAPAGYAVAWYGAADDDDDDDDGGRSGGLWFRRLDPAGMPVDDAVQLSSGMTRPAALQLLWDGSRYALFWAGRSDTGIVHLTFLDAGGNRIGRDLTLADGPMDAHGVSAQVGRDADGQPTFGVLWMADQVVFRLLNQDGTSIGARTILHEDASFTWDPRVVWAEEPGLFGAAYLGVGRRRPDVWFHRFDPTSGQELAPEKEEPAIPSVSELRGGLALAWTGEAFLLGWSDDRDAVSLGLSDAWTRSREVYLRAYDATGDPLGAPERFTTGTTADAALPTLLTGLNRGQRAAVWRTEDKGEGILWFAYGALVCEDDPRPAP